MKRIKLLPIALVSLFALSAVPSFVSGIAKAEEKTYYVDFFNNFKREDFTLSSGYGGRGNNLLYTTKVVTEGSLVEKPTDPARKNYDFLGWFLDEEGTKAWDFATMKVNSGVRLYADWKLSSSSEIVEPTYTPPSTVLAESDPNDYIVDSIMNFDITGDDKILVSTAAISRLVLNKENILPLMEYKAKTSKPLTAKYNELTSEITLTCAGGNRIIEVVDNSEALKVDDVNYESKAKNYEKKIEAENENYHVMLAGSSSIEFWTNSAKDLDPIVSYNHGIGGTTIELWTEKLNQRLVYPYKPKLVVYYVGINNVINTGDKQSDIIEKLTTFFDETHAALPDSHVIYIMLNQLPGYPTKKNIINNINAAAESYQATHSEWLTLTNPGSKLMKDTEIPEPSWAYFRKDGLHLSEYGYILWGGVIKECIVDVLESMSK